MTDFRDLLQQAKLPERTVPVCLRGDLVADFETAERQLELELRMPDTSSLDGGPRYALKERIEALQAEMQQYTWLFRLRALPRHRFQELFNAHEPRRDESGELLGKDASGVNSDTFFPALVRACVVDPELTDDEWTQLLDDKLTDRQFNELAGVAWAVNRGQVDVPFSHAVSELTRSTASA